MKTATRVGTSGEVVRALTGVEGRRLVTHPSFLAFTALTAVWFLSIVAGPGQAADDEFLGYKFLVGAGVIPLAAGAGLAACAAASRARRSGADELYGALPVEPWARTAAHLLSVGHAVLASVGLVVLLTLVVGGWDGLPTPVIPDGLARPPSLTPSVAELAQGPALVALVGVVAVALAVCLRSAAATSFAVLVGLYLQAPAVLWWSWDWQRWLLPLAPSVRTSGSVEVSPERWLLDVRGVDRAGIRWHLLYLVGLILVVSGTALARHRPWRRLRGLVGGGVAAVITGGVLQVVSST